MKIPLPTPRSISTNRSQQKSSTVPEFEYLQFSLRITEDIIRNDLYTNKEMQRVFNSHIEANRGRLSMVSCFKNYQPQSSIVASLNHF